jgi:phage I-like protein
MPQKMGYLVDLSTVKFDDSTENPTSWIQAMPIGKYDHALYGAIDITPERVQRFADNVKNKVREIDPDIDYDHKSKTSEAAGWVKDAEARTDGLWVLVEWTKSAAQKIKEKAYKYFSPEFDDTWTHPKTKQEFKDVLFGGGITNRPFLKDILPLNLSEAFEAADHNQEGVTMSDALKGVKEKLGLPETATDEEVLAKLDELSKPADPPQDPPQNDPANPPQQEKLPELAQLSEEIKKLGESHPVVKSLTDIIEAQGRVLSENSKQLREANTVSRIRKLDEVAGKKGYAIPPVVKEKLTKAFNEGDTIKASDVEDAFTKLMEVGLVDKLEHGHERQSGEVDAVKQFNEKVASTRDSLKLSYADAVVKVSQDEPELFASYRAASYAGSDN